MDRLVYSFWTCPALGENPRWRENNQLIKNVNLYTLSVLFLKDHFKEIVLYTDTLGASLLKFLPFTEVHVVLDDVSCDDRIWVKGKFIAFEKETKPFIHVDGDVLISKEEALNMIKNFKSDVIVQGYDNEFESHYGGQMSYYEKFFDIEKLGYSFNMGVIGFNNIALKNEYMKNVRKWLKVYFKQEEFRECDAHFEPCIMIEQYNLTNLLYKKGVEPDRILGNRILDLSIAYCNEIGYAHLTGLQKYGEHYQGMVMKRLEETYPRYYNLLLKTIKINA
jgi:hypothetical protein